MKLRTAKVYFTYRRKLRGMVYCTHYKDEELWQDSNYNSCKGKVEMQDKEGVGKADVMFVIDENMSVTLEQIFERFISEVRKNRGLPSIVIKSINIR